MSIHDLAFSVSGYLVSAFLFINCASIAAPDSRLMPLIIASMLAVLSTVQLCCSYFSKSKTEYLFEHRKRVVLVLVLLTAYIALTCLFGLYLCTPFFIFLVMLALGQKNKKLLASIPLLTTLIIFFLFTYIFAIPVPTGILLAFL